MAIRLLWGVLKPVLWAAAKAVAWVGHRRAEAQRRALPLHKAPSASGASGAHGAAVEVWAVGNWIVGGAGKTPLVQALCAELQHQGRRPGVVSRGVGSSARGVVVIPAGGTASAGRMAGDEPALLAHRCGVPVAAGSDRRAAAESLLAQHPDIDLILLDDGLTQTALPPSRRIAVIDERLMGNGCLLPAGPLRRPWPPLPGEAPDVVVFRDRSARALAEQAHLLQGAGSPTVRELRLDVVGLQSLSVVDGNVVRSVPTPAQGSGGPALALAAIAVPERFFDMLRQMGHRLERSAALPDHAQGLIPAIDALVGIRSPEPWPILITEKDQVKLIAEVDALLRAGQPIPAWLPRCQAVLLYCHFSSPAHP